MPKKVFSRKYVKIISFNTLAQASNAQHSSNSKIMIHTSVGIYVGKLKEQVDCENLDFQDNDDPLTNFNKIYLRLLENYENSDELEELKENSLSIELEDVELITSSRTISLPFVEIFTDQIIGISVGSVD